MIDQTIANTALPTIARDLHSTAAASIWVINAYQVAVTVCIVPCAALADIVGFARVYRFGLATFVASSLACALAPSLLVLALARMLQGVGGAIITVTTGPLNRLTFPPAMLGRAVGYTAMVVALGAASGPVIGGLILAVAPWPWLFAINVPVLGVTLLLAYRVLPEARGHGGRFDWPSAALSAATFGLGVLAFESLGHQASPLAVALELVCTAILGVVFIRRQLRVERPMFAVDLLRSRRLVLAIVACFGSFVSQTIAYVALPFGFQTVMGRTPLQIGLLLLPWLLAAAATAPFAGRFADRWGTSRMSAAGLAVFTLGLWLLAVLPAHANDLDVVWRMLIAGFGYGVFQSPNNRAIQSSAPRERAGGAQGLQSTARLVGQTLGATLVALIFGLSTAAHAAHGTDAGSVRTAMLVAVGFAAASALAALARYLPAASRNASNREGTLSSV